MDRGDGHRVKGVAQESFEGTFEFGRELGRGLGVARRQPDRDGRGVLRPVDGTEAQRPLDEDPPVRLVVICPAIRTRERDRPHGIRGEGQSDRVGHRIQIGATGDPALHRGCLLVRRRRSTPALSEPTGC